MLKRNQTYIDTLKGTRQEPWEEEMRRQERWLNRAIVLVMVFAVIYFAPVIWHILTR